MTSHCILHAIPSILAADTVEPSMHSRHQDIEFLMQQLERGPLMAVGHFGPKNYTVEPFALKDSVCKQTLYGWKPGAPRTPLETPASVFVLGARKTNACAQVFFSLSHFFTSTKRYIHRAEPLPTDRKIYVISFRTFCQQLTSMCLAPIDTDKEFIDQLLQLPLEGILDEGAIEERCKQIGQKIFDTYKEEEDDSSVGGFTAAQRIFDAIGSKIFYKDSLRKQYIERAWDGVGDDAIRWQA